MFFPIKHLSTPRFAVVLSFVLGDFLAAQALAQDCGRYEWVLTDINWRQSHRMVFDLDRGMLFQAGTGGESFTGDSWYWMGSAWEQASASPMLMRIGFGMAYDEDRQVVVVYGGRFNNTFFGDTLEWNGSNWSQRSSTGPSPRVGVQLAYDTQRKVCVMYGGGLTSVFRDTWEWDGNTWRFITNSGPPPLNAYAMTYDSNRHVTVLHGGATTGGAWSNETWEWDGAQWAHRSTAGPRFFQPVSAAFDSARGVTVLFHGERAETWEWNGQDWTLRATQLPPRRSRYAIAYDRISRRTYLHGGGPQQFSLNPYNDTWAWDGEAWERLDSPQPDTTELYGGYDIENNRVVYCGRVPHAAGFETWGWNGQTWVRLQFGEFESSLDNFAVTFDSTRDVLVEFGGTDGTYANNHTWEFDGAAWAQRQSPHAPTPRMGHCMAFDSNRGLTVLFGGGPGVSSDSADTTWEWDGTDWIFRTSDGPPAQKFAATAYDPVRAVTVMYGLGETWEWDGDTWQLRSAIGPPPFERHALAWNPEFAGILLYGAEDESSTWLWDGQNWEQLTANDIPPRKNAMIVYDSDRHETLLYGGVDDRAFPSTTYRALWAFVPRRPSILEGPADQIVSLGDNIVIAVQADVHADSSFRWFRGEAQLFDDARISGSSTATLQIRGARLSDAGEYGVILSDDCGETRSHNSVVQITISECVSDLNGDGIVDLEDLAVLLSQFGTITQPPQVGDIDASGVIDLQDLSIFLSQFAQSC